MTRLRVALVGLGDIAQKAYLPVLATRSDLEIVLVTRTAATLDRLGAAYRIADRHTELAAAVDSGLDAAFVHAATEAHPELVSRLLDARVPVFVDKPLAYSYPEAADLVEHARSAGVGLTVGFNRRHAPAYRELAGWADRDLVVMQKHRAGPVDDVRRSVFDDFIHVVDTLRYLGPDGALSVTARAVDGGLQHVAISLAGGGRLAVGLMSRVAGLTEETLEVVAPGRKRRVLELATVLDLVGTEQTTRRDEWTPVGVQRGFAQVCEAFLADVRSGRVSDPADALATHAMCESIVEQTAG